MSRVSRSGRTCRTKRKGSMSLAQGLGRTLIGGLLVAWLGGAAATERPFSAEPTDAAAQHRAISAERATVEQGFNTDSLACQQRFRVSDCLARAKLERRQAMNRLQQQALQLDDAKRRHKAAQRLQLQQQRRADAAAQAASAATSPQRPKAQSGDLGKAGPAAVAANPGLTAEPASQPVAGREQQGLREQRRLAQHNSRLAAAKAHQQALEARNADQLGKRPAAAALPVPGASSP